MSVFGLAASAVLGGLNSVYQNYLNNKAMQEQNSQAMANQGAFYRNWLSPSAQAREYAKAGLSPAAAMSNGQIQSMSPSAPVPSTPVYSTGILDMKTLGDYFKTIQEAKKAGADTSVAEADAKLKLLQQNRDSFELELRKYFARPQMATELALAYQNVLLARDSHDLNEINKAVGEWNKVKAKAESETAEHNRDIVKKVLDNTDKKLELENRESEARGSASFAVANASNAAAKLSTEQARTESDMRDLRVTAQTLANGISALNYDLDSKTLQSKVEELANRVGAVKWSNLMAELQYKDAATYNAIQRLLRGNSQKGDIGQILKALKNYEELKLPK